MNTLELFSERDRTGESVNINSDNPDLMNAGFNNRARSLRVTGHPWVVFTETNYKGDFEIYKEGDQELRPGFENNISSVRIVKGDLVNPEITLYHEVNYVGRSVTLKTSANDLTPHGFDKATSSHKVKDGVWILYDGKNYQGKKMVALAGDQVPDYNVLTWNNKVSSIQSI